MKWRELAADARETMKNFFAPENISCHLCQTLLWEGENLLCASCAGELEKSRIPPQEAASRLSDTLLLEVSAFWYQTQAKELILALKFGHDRRAALPLAYGMAAAYGDFADLLASCRTAVSVPSHAARVDTRGYVQAELLAEAFCEIVRLPYERNALKRVDNSASQVSRNREERLRSMEGAFTAQRLWKGEALLLIDDVLTTGATATACARCLLEAGASQVALLTACKA